jgi:hypothetical protein
MLKNTEKPDKIHEAERRALIDNIRNDVAELIERDHYLSLRLVMESTGYLSNRVATTSAQIGAAIIALANILEPFWLRTTASAAAFERAVRRNKTNFRSRGAWSTAQRAADRARLLPRLKGRRTQPEVI